MRQWPILAFVLFFSCDNKPAESRFDKIAKAYCECTGQLAALNEKTATLAADTNAVTTFQDYLRQIQAEYGKAQECTKAIVSQFGKLDPAELDSVKTALTTRCSHLAEQGDLLQEMLGE